MKIRLSKPLVLCEGDAAKTIEELDLDLDALTGADVDFCVREASAAKGELVRVLVTDLDFHMQVAAKSSGIGVDALRKLSARDYVEVATAVQGFLVGSV